MTDPVTALPSVRVDRRREWESFIMKSWEVVGSREEEVKERKCSLLAVSRWRKVRLSVPFVSGAQLCLIHTIPSAIPCGGESTIQLPWLQDKCNLADRKIAHTWCFSPVDTDKCGWAENPYRTCNYILTIMISKTASVHSTLDRPGVLWWLSALMAIERAIPSPSRICPRNLMHARKLVDALWHDRYRPGEKQSKPPFTNREILLNE
jgi:hypothetical protein